MRKHIFLSYSSKDLEIAERIEAQLKANDFIVWRDKEQIRTGDEWPKTIEKAVYDSWALVAMLTPNSQSARWVNNEIEAALNKGIKVLPILIEGDIWFSLASIQYFDLRGKTNKPLPDELYEMLIEIAPPSELTKEDGVNLAYKSSDSRVQKLELIFQLEPISQKNRSPKGITARKLLDELTQDRDVYVRNAAHIALKKAEDAHHAGFKRFFEKNSLTFGVIFIVTLIIAGLIFTITTSGNDDSDNGDALIITATPQPPTMTNTPTETPIPTRTPTVTSTPRPTLDRTVTFRETSTQNFINTAIAAFNDSQTPIEQSSTEEPIATVTANNESVATSRPTEIAFSDNSQSTETEQEEGDDGGGSGFLDTFIGIMALVGRLATLRANILQYILCCALPIGLIAGFVAFNSRR